MKIYSPLFLLGALGALSAAGTAAAQVDTSAWKCSACPYPKGSSGTVEAGLGVVSDDSAKFGDYTGLDREGAHLVLGGTLRYRGDGGYFADLAASDLGLDSRRLAARTGREGLYTLRLGYSRNPAPPVGQCVDAVPRQRRRRVDAAGRLSGRQHGGDAAGKHAAAGRTRLQAIAPGHRRRVDRRRELDLPHQPAPRRARRHAAHGGIVLRHRGATGGTGGPRDRPVRGGRVVRQPPPAGHAGLPVLAVPQWPGFADLGQPVHAGVCRQQHGPARTGAGQPVPPDHRARSATRSRRRSAPAPISRSGA